MTVIARLQAENYKRLRAVEIAAGDGTNLVPLVGKNAQGKSSILDAITAALGGKNYMPSKPVRKGEEEGAIVLELSNGIRVRRIFAEDGSGSIVVENEDGARYPSPQAMLDKLYSSVAFDPIAFTRLKPAEQLATLRRLVKLEVDVDALDKASKADYETRRDVNRDIRTWEGQLAALQHLPDEETAAIDTAALETKIAEAAEHNGQIERRKANREQAAIRVQEHHNTARRWMDERARLLREADDAEKKANEATDAADELQKQLDEAEALPEPIDVAEVQEQLREARETIAKNERIREKKAIAARLKNLRAQSKGLTEAMETRELAKAKAFEAANMPVPGLSFGEGEVLFNGLPLDQASAGEQLRISTAIGIATAPELRVMLVRDASLLDDEGYSLLAKMAVDHDFQLWVESVDTTGRVGIVIEDGAVKDAPAPEPIDKGRRRKKQETAGGGEPETVVDPASGQGEEPVAVLGASPDKSTAASEGAPEAPAERAGGEEEGADRMPPADAPSSDVIADADEGKAGTALRPSADVDEGEGAVTECSPSSPTPQAQESLFD